MLFSPFPGRLRRTVRAAVPAVLATLTGWGGLCPGCSSFASGSSTPTGDPAAWPARLPELREGVRRHPQDLDLLAQLGLSYFFSDSCAQADSVAKLVLVRQPRQGLALFVRALIHEREGDWESADSIYRQVDDLHATTRELRRIMRSRHEIASREIIRRQVQVESQRWREARFDREGEGALEVLAAPAANTLLVQGFAPLGVSRSDTVLATGVTYFLTTTLAQTESLIVVDYTRRELLEDEILRSATASPGPLQLRSAFCGAALSITGRAGIPDPGAAAWIQYGVADATVDPGDPDYRGTRDPRELSPPTRYLLSDLGSEVVWIVEDRLHLTLSPDLRGRLARAPTQSFEAFMAFAEGLFWEQRNQFGRATASFQAAAELDPEFVWAREGAERMVGVGERGEALPPRMDRSVEFSEGLAERTIGTVAAKVDPMPIGGPEAPLGTADVTASDPHTLILIDPRVR